MESFYKRKEEVRLLGSKKCFNKKEVIFMKKTGTIIGLLIVLGIAAIALALAFSSPGSADPTGASYVMPTVKRQLQM